VDLPIQRAEGIFVPVPGGSENGVEIFRASEIGVAGRPGRRMQFLCMAHRRHDGGIYGESTYVLDVHGG
jgi:hypothetical protein